MTTRAKDWDQWWKERTDSCKLTSDLRMYSTAHPHTHSIAHEGPYKQTHVQQMQLFQEVRELQSDTKPI